MSSSNQESAPNDQVARLPSGALGAGRGRVTTRSASSSLLPTATSRQSTPRVNPTEIRRGVKRTSPDLATEPIPGAQAGPQFRTASQEEEEEEPRNERAESTHSGLSRSEIRGLLRISEQRTQQDFRELLSESDRRNQQLVDDAERRHQEQMAETQAQNAYSQARNDQLLELLQTMARSINPPPRSPAPDPASSRQEPHHPPSTPFTRRAPRFSTASNLVFGNEDAHALPASFESRPPPPHLAQHTPFAFHSGEYPHPRAAKSKDIGIFKPEEGHVAYSWWMGLVQYKAFSGVSDQEIFMGLPGCFETGRAKEWFNSLTPRPKTLEEFRARLFEHFTRDESQILEEVNTRHFQPESETLDKYLDSKHRLISELHVARAVNRGPTDLDFSSIDTIMTSQTVADVIALVHQGLPAHWGVLLDGVKDNARDWPHYRASLIGREQRTRLALSMLKLKDKEPLPRANINTSSHFGAAAVPRPATAGRPFSLPHTTRPAPFGRPARSAEDEATRRKDIELGRCFHCHTTDHAKRDCPRLQEARRTVRAALTQLEEGSDDEATDSIVRSIGALAVFDVVSVSKEQHSRSAEEDDDVARVRHARRVSISEVDEDAPRVRITRKETTIELPGRRHRDVVAHKVAVHMGNDQEQFELHVDGGSPLSMVTSRALRTISPDAQILPPERLKIKGYRGDEFQRPSGVVLLPVSFPTTNDVPAVKHRFEFHVVEECTGGWILGVDNMKADGIDALSKRERLVFEHRPDAIVPLLQAHSHRDFVSSPNHLVCARHTTIAAHTARLVEIDPVSADKIVQPWWFTHEEAPTGFVKVPSCIVGPNTKGIEVFNVSDVDVEFREGDVLGATEPLDGTLADLSELDDAIRHTRGPSIPPLSRSLHEWKKGNSGPVAATVRRVVFTNAEPDGGDVLPEIDFPTPSNLQQTVTCSSQLNAAQRARLVKVLEAHAVWPTPARPLGLYEYGEVSLRVRVGQENWTHAEPPRRTSPAQKDVIDETIKEHDTLGISEPSQGPYASGVVLVQQRDKIRFCNDYRPLNKVTVDDYYAMPTIDAVYDQLGDCRFFTVVDANKGYYQFFLDAQSRDLTGFITFRGLRRYRRLPFGLKQAPSWFQRAMDRILGNARWVYALAYLDDVVIYSKTFNEHLEHLDAILAAIERAGLTISPSKCRFAFESVALLGYRVSSLGLMTDPEKMRAVAEFPEPTTPAEARRFFAMAAWYRRFIVGFAGRAQAINKSFVGETFVWGSEEKAAFSDVKRALTDTPILKSPNFKRPFILAVDASKQGLGGVLMQTDDAGFERPILFISRQTTDGEKKYAPTHLELAAIWWCVKKLQHYIDGSSVEVRTDHNALRWLWDLKPSDIHETRVQKFKMALTPLENKITISYNRGKDNVVADALSRAPLPARPEEEERLLSFVAKEYKRLDSVRLATEADAIIRSVTTIRMHPNELGSWADAYAADPRWRRIWKRALSRSQADSSMAEVDPPAARRLSGERSGSAVESELEAYKEPVDQPGMGEEAADSSEDEGDGKAKAEADPAIAEPVTNSIDQEDSPVVSLSQPGSTRTLRPRTVLAVHRSRDDDLYLVRDGLLFVQIKDGVRLCVPMPMLNTLVHEYHTSIRSGHPSVERTVAAMSDHIFAHDLAQRVSAHVRTCYECQVNKAHRHKAYGEMQPIVTPNTAFDTIAMDFVTGLPKTGRGHDSILVVADKYTRFAFFLPNRTTDTAEMVALLFLERVFPTTGLPNAIISDRDAKFTSSFWSTLMENLDIKLRMSTAYHPQTDGLVERLNGQLETMLRHYVAIDQHDWDTKLAALSMAYNGQKQESTTQSPYLMVFGKEPALFPLKTVTTLADPTGLKVNDIFAIHADAQAEMELARERQRRAYNSRHQPMEFAVGDHVLVDLTNYRLRLDPTDVARSKLGPKYAGPFPVKSRVGRLAYELSVPPWFKAHPVLPITALEPFKGDPATSTPRPQAGIAAEGGRDELRVKAFLGCRPSALAGGTRFDYLVKWDGEPPTWQSDNRLPLLAWARDAFEKRARTALGMKRLRHHSTIVLPEARSRAMELEAEDKLPEGVA